MKIVDLNILIYATDTQAPQHVRARDWWEESLNEPEPIGLAWSVLLGSIRLLTNPKAARTPLSTEQAIDIVEQWLAAPNVVQLTPQSGHLNRIRSIFHHVTSRNSQMRLDMLLGDFHLAALALETGGTIYSNDTDFAHFKEIRWINPLA